MRANRDRRNLALILAGAVALVLLLPPAHDYPIIDDWIYAGSVQHQLATGVFVMPAASQANLVGLTLWGTLWARVFGFSYTTLTWSTLVLALGGLLAFYGLARRVRVPPGGALVGTALLGLNPLFLHLSYSFMTDVPFLALTLGACYGYVRGLQTRRPAWLLVAGVLAGWAFLIRQFGILVPAAFLGYLLLDGLRGRRLHLPQIAAVIVIPTLILAGWWLWSHGQPPNLWTAALARRRAMFMFTDAWLRVILIRALTLLPLAALSAWGAVRLRRRRLWLVPLWAGVLIAGWVAVGGLHENWIATTDPPFLIRVGPLALLIPAQVDTFIGYGNILRLGGLDFADYLQMPLWPRETWVAILVLGAGLGALLLAKVTDVVLRPPRMRRDRRLSPLLGVYLAGLLIAGVSLAALTELYDRYLLGFLPFLILFVVRGSRTWGRLAWGYALTALAIVGVVGMLLQADAVDHDNARWQAAQWLAVGEGAVHAGYDWDNVNPGRNATSIVSDLPRPGFRVEARFPYLSRMAGFQTREVLALVPAIAPPVPARGHGGVAP